MSATDAGGGITVIEADGGLLLLGPERALAALDRHEGVRPRKVASRTLVLAGQALGVASQVGAASGRWVKLTKESVDYLDKAGIRQVAAGVVRDDRGRILKHLTFDKAALLTPAAPAALAALATQAALEAALDDITEYLEVIDAKLDRLLQQRKLEVTGQLGGVTLALEEAHAIYTETGTVSSVTWSKVQANTLALQTMQAEAVAQLDDLADRVRRHVGDTDAAARALKDAQTDVVFWLGVLARAMALQDRQYVLELARVADAEPAQLDAHHQGIRAARAERARRVGRGLEAVLTSVRDSAVLRNVDRVANPFSAQQVTRGANDVNRSVADFATHADLELLGGSLLEAVSWGSAARALVDDAGELAGGARDAVAGHARSLREQLRERREEGLLARADKVRARRLGRGGDEPANSVEEHRPPVS